MPLSDCRTPLPQGRGMPRPRLLSRRGEACLALACVQKRNPLAQEVARGSISLWCRGKAAPHWQIDQVNQRSSFRELRALGGVGAPDAARAYAGRGIVIDEPAVSSRRREGRIAIDDVGETVNRVAGG